MDLAALNGAELRRLLDSARQRGQAEQSYRILEEMARRREVPATRRKAQEPRIISMDFGDPLERRDETFEDERPNTDEPDADPVAALTLDREPDRPRRKMPAAPSRWRWPTATFAAGAALGVAGGLWFADSTSPPPPPSPELAAFQAEVAPPPTPPVAEPTPQPPTELAQAPASEPPPTEATSPETAAQDAATSAEPAPPPEPVAETPPEPTPKSGTCDAATPADRVICGDARLQRLQRDLRRAYAEALDAHAERDLLRERQLAWRDERSAVTDRDRLAALYAERIRKLDAATADARRQR